MKIVITLVAPGKDEFTTGTKHGKTHGLVYDKNLQEQGHACSDMADMVLIKWPYVSPLYFTKPGVHWEYATVAGESAQAFVYFTEAGRRA